MMADASVIEAITAATVNNLPLQNAMLLGSYLESGWDAHSVGDNNTSFGPFQIHLPVHPDITKAEAEDPNYATKYMLPEYQKFLVTTGDPMQAALLTAFHAERPKNMYPANRVQAAWAAVKNAQNSTGAAGMSGSSTGGNQTSPPATSSSDLPWPFNVIGDQIAAITPFFSDADQILQKVFGLVTKLWLPSTWVRISAFSGGLVCVFIGLFLFFTKPRTAINTVEGVGRTVASMVP